MNKRKTFACIFAGVVAAGLLGLGIGFILRAAIPDNAIVTIISLFMIISGIIMAGIGLIAMLICLLMLPFGSGGKSEKEEPLNQKIDAEVSKETGTDNNNIAVNKESATVNKDDSVKKEISPETKDGTAVAKESIAVNQNNTATQGNDAGKDNVKNNTAANKDIRKKK